MALRQILNRLQCIGLGKSPKSSWAQLRPFVITSFYKTIKIGEKVKLGNFGQFWTILGNFGQFWAILGNFGPFLDIWILLCKVTSSNIFSTLWKGCVTKTISLRELYHIHYHQIKLSWQKLIYRMTVLFRCEFLSAIQELDNFPMFYDEKVVSENNCQVVNVFYHSKIKFLSYFY